MRSKTKFLSMLMVLLMSLSVLTACSPAAPAEEPAPPAEEPAEEPAQEPAEEPAEEPALDPEEVLKEAALDLLNNIPDNNFIMASDEALALFEENPGAVFWVDLRSADDYAAGHIAGAVNIPYGEMGNHWEVLPTNRQIIFQCYSGQTSAQVTSLANMLGFNAVSFRGGMNFGWAPLELGEDTLEMEANELPEAKAPELDEKEQIIWDAAVDYFSADNYIIAPADLLALVEENPDAITVVDIRQADAYAEGHIEGAIHIPFKEVGANVDQIPMNRPAYVTCYTGQTAGITIAPLRMMGYNAISLNRGMTGWDGAELPKVTD
ncbi:rhodanese-like domain-containing protein [Gudongella sp. SC589]|uniref:rhodanese-like domain-containing protein n=1 Tax=Gudongella sp. SC589 TaxID=3385990 RepID=UPI003904BE5F